MRITILAPGSRGDIQPYVALGRGLSAAGHSVRIVTTNDHAALVAEHSLELWAVDINIEAALQEAESRAAIEGGSVLASFRQLSTIAKRGARLTAETALAACEGVDAVLTGFGGLFLGWCVAERLGLPLIQAYNVPLTPTREFPGALVPWLSFWPKGFFHRLGHRISRQIVWLTARAAGNEVRRSLFGLPSAPRLGPFDGDALGRGPTLYGFSEAVLGKPADWGERVEVTGYWFLDASAEWTPPADLVTFLKRGPEPVYVGFGSMSSREPEKVARVVLDALRARGQRAILHAGWGGLCATDLPDTVFAVRSVPHAWLFDHVAAVVHHGGAGTTAAAIRAGVPSVVVPFHGDQPFWARQVARLGVGPEPIPRKSLTVDRLATAIERAATDVGLRQRASEIGAKVRAEDGVARAVELIERPHAR